MNVSSLKIFPYIGMLLIYINVITEHVTEHLPYLTSSTGTVTLQSQESVRITSNQGKLLNALSLCIWLWDADIDVSTLLDPHCDSLMQFT